MFNSLFTKGREINFFGMKQNCDKILFFFGKFYLNLVNDCKFCFLYKNANVWEKLLQPIGKIGAN